MRPALQLFALFIALGTTIYWAASGTNSGWTKNSITITQTDDITGIEYTEYRDGFLPGIDFLGASFACCSLLTAASFFFRKTKNQNLL
jgi:hypothetical protein